MTYKFLFDLALILLSTKLLSMLSNRVHLPQVVGALLAGIVLGPAVLGLISGTEFLGQISEIGVIIIMFTAGVTTDLRELRNAGKAGFLIAVLGVGFPLVCGLGAAYLGSALGWLGETSIIEGVFLGTVLTATSVSITVETLRELGKLDTKVGGTLIAAALIDDVLGLIVLTVVNSLAGESVNIPVVLLKIVLFFAFCIVVFILVSRFFRWMLSHHIGQKLHLYPALAFVLCLVMAFCAEEIFGVAGIIGAFAAGLVVSTTEKAKFIESKFATLSQMLLTPVFFAGIGLKVELSAMGGGTLLFALLLLVVAIGSKIVGCGFASKALGFDGHECLQIGTGMACRGEVALIVANKGVAMGILGQDMLSAIILMIIGCAVITPIMLKALFRSAPEAGLVHSELAEQMDKLEQLDIVAESLLRKDREYKEEGKRRHSRNEG